MRTKKPSKFKEPKRYTRREMLRHLPAAVSDICHDRQVPSQELISEYLYNSAIRATFSRERFFFEEKCAGESSRVGLFIKGYVRDVWDYLKESYRIIHGADLMKEAAKRKLISKSLYLEHKKGMRNGNCVDANRKGR